FGNGRDEQLFPIGLDWHSWLAGALPKHGAKAVLSPLQLIELECRCRFSLGRRNFDELHHTRERRAVRARPVRADDTRMGQVERTNTLKCLGYAEQRVAILGRLT